MLRSRSWGGGLGGTRGGTAGAGRGGGDGDDVFAAAARLRKGGKWLGELDVRLQLYAENPLLKRCPCYNVSPEMHRCCPPLQRSWSVGPWAIRGFSGVVLFTSVASGRVDSRIVSLAS